MIIKSGNKIIAGFGRIIDTNFIGVVGYNIWVNQMINDYQNRNGALSYRQISTLKTILSPYYVFNNTIGYYYNTFNDRTDSTWLFLMFVGNDYIVTTEI
jgi:hypothetical protein